MSFKRFSYLIITLIIVTFFSCEDIQERGHGINNFNKLKLTDKKLEKPKPGEWLSLHKEAGQSFNQYREVKSIEITEDKKTIHILPIGKFSDLQTRLLNANSEYLKVFFDLDVKILPPIDDELISNEFKRVNGSILQLNASYLINDFLIKHKPEKSLVILGITSKDIFPKPEWNYVFGLASYSKCTAIVSLFRLSNRVNDKVNFTKGLERINKISSHEISHMFSLKHCTNAVCLMNGTNNLSETDSKPNALCSECMAKLSWKFKFNNIERLKKIKTYFYDHDLVEDFETITEQLNAIQ